MNPRNTASTFPVRRTLLWRASAVALAPGCLAIVTLTHWAIFDMPPVAKPVLELLAALPLTALYLIPFVLLFALPYLALFAGLVWAFRRVRSLDENVVYAGLTSLGMALPSAVAITLQGDFTVGVITLLGASAAIFIPRLVLGKLATRTFNE